MSITLDGTTGIVAPSVTGTPVIGGLVSGTAVSASGTSVDFTGIPSWAKRITVMFSGVSTNGTSIPLIQLGDAGGIENTGYSTTAGSITGAATANTFTTGFGVAAAHAAASLYYGVIELALLGSNNWTASGNLSIPSVAQTVFAGGKTLSDTLTQVRITTVNGTDTFDAGTINIMYEG